MIYLIHGPDRLLAREAAQRIASELDPDGANTTWLDGRETPLERLIVAVGTVSFFGGAPVVVVSDLLARGGREASDDTGSGDDERGRKGHPGLAPLVRAVPDHHRLILLEPSLTAPPAALKSVAPDARIIAGEPPRGRELVNWIGRAAQRAGTTIDQRAAQLLVESLYPQTWDRKPSNPRYDRPPDMALLTHEIEKLALAAYPDAVATEHVSTLVPGGPNQRVFRYLDAALAGDLRTAFGELERLHLAGEEPAMLLAQTLGQIELDTLARVAGNRQPADVARDIGSVAASRMSAVISSARRQRRATSHVITAGAAADRRLKTGRTRRPEDALYNLTIALADKPHEETGHST